MKPSHFLCIASVCVSTLHARGVSGQAPQSAPVPLARFVEATQSDDRIAAPALQVIAAGWKNSYTSMFIDLARMMRPPRQLQADTSIGTPRPTDDNDSDAGGRPSIDAPMTNDLGSPIRRRLLTFLGRQTGQRFGDDLPKWRSWMWTLPYDPHPDYAALKGLIYGQIDSRMREFFPPDVKAAIRLDEVDWGGVKVNGIPPLRLPNTVTARDANYLGDSNVVFGIVVNGEARAYPKRILAWHEMAIDRVGGVDLTIVYCTLCGTVIPYESAVGGRVMQFGTSGLLYQSNKLMFDEGTMSLWSTLEGTPVVGALVGSGLTLRARPAVTTTWKEWRTTHPTTTVLSLNTGHQRDYSEGAAYRDYFASDRLMFQVSRTDDRLPSKAEVVVFRTQPADARNSRVPVAIDIQLLRRRPVYSFDVGTNHYTVITTKGGANQVYRTTVDIPDQRSGEILRDGNGGTWRVTDTALVSERAPSEQAPRVSAYRAFWFGWYAQFPDTVLLK